MNYKLPAAVRQILLAGNKARKQGAPVTGGPPATCPGRAMRLDCGVIIIYSGGGGFVAEPEFPESDELERIAMPTSLVVGANRGIGLEMCRQLLERGEQVIATCRTADADLESLGATVLNAIDVADPESIARLAESLGNTQLDLLLHNAGILTSESLDDLDFDRMLKQFQVNTLGPLRVVHALLGNLKAGSKVGIVSSRVGSLADNASGGNYGYRVSKAAVNMVGVNLAHDLRAREVPVMLLHPGLVATEMTGGRGIEPAAAARGLIAQMDELSMADTGTFRHAEGYVLPW